jgi:hypothetical protein
VEAKQPVIRITIKELMLEIEDEEGVKNLGRSLAGLFQQAAPATAPEGVQPKRRGRPPKAAVAPAKEARKRRRPRAESATAQIRTLRDEGFFEQPRRAQEVKVALIERGYRLDNRQVYATLKYMADAKDLLRTTSADDSVYLYSNQPAE